MKKSASTSVYIYVFKASVDGNLVSCLRARERRRARVHIVQSRECAKLTCTGTAAPSAASCAYRQLSRKQAPYIHIQRAPSVSHPERSSTRTFCPARKPSDLTIARCTPKRPRHRANTLKHNHIYDFISRIPLKNPDTFRERATNPCCSRCSRAHPRTRTAHSQSLSPRPHPRPRPPAAATPWASAKTLASPHRTPQPSSARSPASASASASPRRPRARSTAPPCARARQAPRAPPRLPPLASRRVHRKQRNAYIYFLYIHTQRHDARSLARCSTQSNRIKSFAEKKRLRHRTLFGTR